MCKVIYRFRRCGRHIVPELPFVQWCVASGIIGSLTGACENQIPVYRSARSLECMECDSIISPKRGIWTLIWAIRDAVRGVVNVRGPMQDPPIYGSLDQSPEHYDGCDMLLAQDSTGIWLHGRRDYWGQVMDIDDHEIFQDPEASNSWVSSLSCRTYYYQR